MPRKIVVRDQKRGSTIEMEQEMRFTGKMTFGTPLKLTEILIMSKQNESFLC